MPSYLLDTAETMKSRISIEKGVPASYIITIDGEYVNLLDKLKEGTVNDALGYKNKTKLTSREYINLLRFARRISSEQFLTSAGVDENDIDPSYSPETFQENMNRALREAGAFVESTTKRIQEFEEVQARKTLSPFVVEKINFDLPILNDDVTIQDLFNSVSLSSTFPVMAYSDYTKILRNYTLNPDWSFERYPDKMHGKVMITREESKLYSNVFVTTQYIRTTLDIDKGVLPLDEYIQRITDALEIDLNFGDVQDNYIAGTFFIMDASFDIYVFADIAMNDLFFTNYFSVDESNRASKTKGEEGTKWVYIHFVSEGTGEITASISQREITDKDRDLLSQGYKLNSTYIRVRVSKAKNKQAVEKFMDIFNKFLTVYEEKKKSIVDAYRVYLPTFGTEKQRELVQVNLKQKGKDLFGSGYTTSCQGRRQPKVLAPSEAVGLEPERIHPYTTAKGDNIILYCTEADYKYPGLQTKKTEEGKDPIYFPCCFKSPYNWDANNKQEGTTKSSVINTSNRIMNVGTQGKLPSELETLLNSITPGHVRQGASPKSGMSALYCMNSIFRANRKMSDVLERIAVCSQSTFNTSLSELENVTFLDLRIFYRALEELFNVNILQIDKTGVVAPFYVEGLYEVPRPDRKVVILYTHLGSASDSLTNPQAEVVMRTPSMTIFPYSDSVVQTLYFLRKGLINSLSLTRSVRDDGVYPDMQMLSQVIDAYGKCRGVQVRVGGDETFSLMFDPRAPLLLPIDNKVYKLRNFDLLGMFEIAYQTKSTVTNEVVSVTFTYRGTDYTVHTKGIAPIDGVQTIMASTTQSGTSQLYLFNTAKRMARYTLEYAIWLLSTYIYDKNINVVTQQVLDAFAEENIIVDPEFDACRILKVGRVFTIDSPLLRNGRLVLRSDEAVKKLMYTIKLVSVRDTVLLQKYRTKTSLRDYYLNVSDYDLRPQQVILQGQFTLDKWIRNQDKQSYKLYKDLQVSRDPYFVVLDDKVYLAQSCDTLKEAQIIYTLWDRDRINPRYIPEIEDYQKISSVNKLEKINRSTGGIVTSSGGYTVVAPIERALDIDSN